MEGQACKWSGEGTCNVTCSLPYLPVRRMWNSLESRSTSKEGRNQGQNHHRSREAEWDIWVAACSPGSADEVARDCQWEQCHCSEMPLCWTAVLISGSEGKACLTPAACWCCFRGCSRTVTAGLPTTTENTHLCLYFLTARRPTNRYTCEMHANLNSGGMHLVEGEELPAWSTGNTVPLNWCIKGRHLNNAKG